MLAAAALAVPSAASAEPSYYLSLGDSLAQGVQPDSLGRDRPTTHGYADDIAARLRGTTPGLQLVKLGCAGGETSTTMRKGGRCRYAAGSQLGEAVSFLQAHRGRVSLVTVNIGDNDVERCVGAAGVNSPCVSAGMTAVDANLPVIAQQLRDSAGPGVPIVGVADYDQFLALWLRGAQGRAIAKQSVGIVRAINIAVGRSFLGAGLALADLWRRFASGDLKHLVPLTGRGRVPRGVQRICSWTWACSSPSFGLDDHANATGYSIIADGVLARIPRVSGATSTGGTSAP